MTTMDYDDLLLALAVKTTDPSETTNSKTHADLGYQPDGKRRFPLECGKVKLSWTIANRKETESEYDAADLVKIKDRIKKAARRCNLELESYDD